MRREARLDDAVELGPIRGIQGENGHWKISSFVCPKLGEKLEFRNLRTRSHAKEDPTAPSLSTADFAVIGESSRSR